MIESRTIIEWLINKSYKKGWNDISMVCVLEWSCFEMVVMSSWYRAIRANYTGNNLLSTYMIWYFYHMWFLNWNLMKFWLCYIKFKQLALGTEGAIIGQWLSFANDCHHCLSYHLKVEDDISQRGGECHRVKFVEFLYFLYPVSYIIKPF